MTVSDSLELKIAQREVQFSRLQVEEALSHLEHKIQDGKDKVEDVIYRAQAPVRFTRENPLAAAGVCAGVGFLIGLWLGRPKRYYYVVRESDLGRLARGRLPELSET